MTSSSNSSTTSSPILQYSHPYPPPLTNSLKPDPATSIPGITHPLTISTIVPSHIYNQLPPRPSSDSVAPVTSSILHHLGRILVAHNLDSLFGAHLIYRRFPISEGNFLTATASRGKKVVYQSALWELGMGVTGEDQKLDFLRGRLVMLRALTDEEGQSPSSSPGRSSFGSNYSQWTPPPPPSRSSNSKYWGNTSWRDSSSATSSPNSNCARHVPTSPSIPEDDETSLKSRCVLGETHIFQAYEYEYGPLHPLLNQTRPATSHNNTHLPPPPIKIPPTFLPQLATFLIENRLENVLGLEVFEYKPPSVAMMEGSRWGFVIEEFDPIGMNRKAAVVEGRGGREVSWGFRRGGRVFGVDENGEEEGDGYVDGHGSGYGNAGVGIDGRKKREQVEVDVEVGLVIIDR